MRWPARAFLLGRRFDGALYRLDAGVQRRRVPTERGWRRGRFPSLRPVAVEGFADRRDTDLRLRSRTCAEAQPSFRLFLQEVGNRASAGVFQGRLIFSPWFRSFRKLRVPKSHLFAKRSAFLVHCKHMWIHPSSVEALCAAHQEAGQAGRAIVGRATEAQALAKRVQFALHRRDHDAAQALMDQVEELYQGLTRAYPPERLQAEAAWRALQEEWLETRLFSAFVQGSAPLTLPTVTPEACIGALSDVLGEVVRLLVRDAAEGSFARLSDARMLADEVLSTLLALDGTGQARQKVDQARSHARRIEDIAYDAALHGRV